MDWYGAHSYYGVSPTLWLSSSIDIASSGEGSYASPYELGDGAPPAGVSLSSTSGTAAGGINLTGMVVGSSPNQTLTISADACNTVGECIRKTTTVNSGEPIAEKEFSLSWSAAELPAGNYNGTVWLKMSTGTEDFYIQSSPVNFVIPQTSNVLNLTVIENVAFSLNLGDNNLLKLVPGTNQGVTVTIVGGKAIATGTLSANTTAVFGDTQLAIQTKSLPTTQITDIILF